ncbi:trans-sialidase [Trypanosoma cruzi cruzi]|nr:trans-sialidase [Trypanosoma cruzi cruzi]PWU85730.1 putative trans-sialidase, Group VI [Trypanosoma cruzi]
MLSRVAAVMAPRTHNRRSVTGSSGRRREGRESERQRPSMSRHLFCSAVLLLVVMMCCNTGGAAFNEKKLSDSEPSKRKLFGWRDTTDEGTVNLLFFPSLVEVNGDVFAVFEALFTRGVEGVFTGIASELLALTGDQQARKELDKNKMETQVLRECSSDDEKCATQAVDDSVSESGAQAHVSKPTTVVHGSDIYMLAGTYNLDGAAAEEDITGEWGLLLARGNVSIVEDSRNKRIYWTDVDALPITSNTEQHEYVTAPLGSGGSGVKMNDGTLVFPMEGEVYRTGKADEENTAEGSNIISLFIYSPDTKSWKLSKGMSADGCGDPSVVEWKDKLMMMTACDDGRRRVYESGDKGESWTEALGTLSRVWGNDEGNEKGVRSGFITATIVDNKKVMLITLPVYSSKDGNGKGVLHLWLTDNTHIVDIGSVSGEEEDVTTSFLLYKGGDNNNKEELIALYEKKERVNHKLSHNIVTVRLTEQLQRVKDVLKTWKKVDESVSQLCNTLLARKDRSTGNACNVDVKITEGLVGFLSVNLSDGTWRDEYLGVNATVNHNGGAEKAKDGVNFRGAWAEWPVGKQGENQLYQFANYNFTLVATVSIDGEPTEGNIPLLGVRADSEEKLMELSYDSEKKWILLCGGGKKTQLSRDWEKEKTQHVVILLRNGNQGSVYVDGQPVGNGECQLDNTEPKVISHFYIGGDGDKKREQEGVSVTVKNVLLYNRPLSSEEITALNPNKAPTPPLEENPSDPSTISSASIIPPSPLVTPNVQKTETPSTPVGTQLTEQGQSMGSSKGAGSGGASASEVSTVSTPSAEEESVMQVTSGTSPDGTQTVGGSSTAVGEPTMQTREGTDGQEEEVNTQVGELNASALSSSLVNVSQRNNSDADTVRGSGLLPSLLLLLGLWGFAAL